MEVIDGMIVIRSMRTPKLIEVNHATCAEDCPTFDSDKSEFSGISQEAKNLANKIGVTDDWRKAIIHCGLHSGIPLCCIVFFAICWVSETMPSKDHLANYHKAKIVMYSSGSPIAGYIQCPNCLLNDLVAEIKSCNCSW